MTSDRMRKPSTRPTPLTAAAMVVAPTEVRNELRNLFNTEEWQTRAWEYYDTVGEFRFGTNWIANALSRVRLIAAMPPERAGDNPTQITEGRPVELVSQLGGGVLGQGQMMAEFGRLLTVSGVSWLVGQSDNEVQWQVRSQDEIRMQGGTIELLQDDGTTWGRLTENDLTVKVWTSHPRKRSQPDAPSRACLPALRQLSLCDSHIDASAVSRLAGAGVMVVPTEAQFPKSNPDSEDDDLVSEMIDAFTTPIGDRSSAAAVVPFVIRVPAAMSDAVRHFHINTPFDERVMEIRDAAIRRLALGLDMPPETLLGVGDVNHWSAWAIQDEAIALHIEPLAEAICHALNLGYMTPAMKAEGLDPDAAMIWYDTSELRTPPDKTEIAITLYNAGAITAQALLRECGFEESDMPSPTEQVKALAARLIAQAPSLLEVAPYLATLAGLPEPEASAESVPEFTSADNPVPTEGAPGETLGTRGPPENPNGAPSEAQVASAMLAVADLHVTRALERAGARLHQAVKKKDPLMASGIPADTDYDEMHCHVSATTVVDLDTLLASAWENVERSALVLGISTTALTSTLDRYTRALIASGTAHDLRRLAAALGTE